MIKKYRTSNLIRILSFGLQRFGCKIDNDTLTIIGIIPKNIPIETIDKISFELSSRPQGPMTYCYIITDKSGKEFKLIYTMLESETYQNMFKEILRINPSITLTDEMKTFVNSEITRKVLKFDFNVYKGQFMNSDRELAQKNPSLDFFIGITIVIAFILIPLVFGRVGNNFLIGTYGKNYESYRIWAVVISRVALTIALINIFISLVSMYLGHKLTIISTIISLIGLCIGLII